VILLVFFSNTPRMKIARVIVFTSNSVVSPPVSLHAFAVCSTGLEGSEEGSKRVRGGFKENPRRVQRESEEGSKRIRGGFKESPRRVQRESEEGSKRVRGGFDDGSKLDPSRFLHP